MKKKTIIVIILFVSIFAGIYLYKNYNIDINSGKIIINEKSNYDASEEIKQALSLLDNSKKAEFITNTDSTSKIVSLSFEGFSDEDTMSNIMDMLDKKGIKATFFVPGIKAAEDSNLVQRIQKDGHDIGNGTLNWKKAMENLSTEQLIDDFCRSNKILKSITGKEPILLKCNSTTYNDNVLTAAYSAGNKYVVDTDHYLSYQSFKDYNQAYQYMNNLKNGTIISIKLEGVLDDTEYGKKRKEDKPAIDKQAGVSEGKNKNEQEVTITQVVEWLLKAIDEQNKNVVKVAELSNFKEDIKLQKIENIINNKDNKTYVSNNQSNKNNTSKTNGVKSDIDLIDFKELIEKNNKKQAPVISEFYTTQKSLSYTFRGLSNAASLDKVLEILENLNAKGTFFVTKDEILKYPDRINKILSKGHEIGNGGITTNSTLLDKSTEEICKEIYEVDKLLKEKGITTNAYMPGYGYISAQIKEALSVITNIPSLKKYELFIYSKAPILSKYKNWNAADTVSNYFNINSYVSLRKGEIVYFRLDSNVFENDDIIGNIINILTKNYVQNGYVNKYNENLKAYDLAQKPLGYSVVTLNNLQNTIETQKQFGRYNITKNQIPLKERTSEDALKMMKTNYIGNESVDLSDFSKEEQLILDKSGNIDTKRENVIFFTFDDWGGDPVINVLLDVLKKHKVNATFFVIGRNVDVNSDISNSNPNLLRTIALNGNDIGSHNYNHELLVTSTQELEDSLTKSYNAMDEVIGDLDSLRPYFRPPTLLLRKDGLLSVFESGYKYCISGNISTHDYESASAQEIVDDIQQGLVENKGNIVVMHMNDQTYYTAEALDIFLTNNEKGLYGVKYKIAKLSDYLEK